MVQVAERLPNKSEALNSNPNTTQKIKIKIRKIKVKKSLFWAAVVA
jgi:hypothetical protein